MAVVKYCSSCGNPKPRREYRSGRGQCRACRNAQRRTRYAEFMADNRDRVNARWRRGYYRRKEARARGEA